MRKNPALHNRETLCVILQDGTKIRLERMARKEGVSLSDIARRALKLFAFDTKTTKHG